MSKITELKTEEILTGITVVKFWAEWCGPCKTLNPIYEEVAGEVSDVKFTSIDIDADSDLAMDNGVRNIPAILIFKDGKCVDRVVGVVQKQTIIDKINTHK